jgi:hypothetical protein
MSKRAFVCAWGVCLQEPVLHLCVSVHKSFVLHLDVSVYKSAAPVRVCLEEICAAPGRVCLQEPVLQLCMYAYKSTAHFVPVDVQCTLVYTFLFGLFSVCFETGMFVSVVSIYVQNTETN